MNHEKISDPASVFKFAVPSVIGILIFLVPFQLDSQTNTLIGHTKEFLAHAGFLNYHALVAAIASVTAALAVIHRCFRPRWIEEDHILRESLEGGALWFIARVCACPIALAAFFLSPQAGAGASAGFLSNAVFMTDHVAPRLVLLSVLMGLFAPLIMDFGLVQFIAVYASPIMRPIFRIPGRSAVDCVASWLGSSSMAVVFTAKMYDSGYYTAREAATIICSFSLTGIYNIYALTELMDMDYAFGSVIAVVYPTMFILAALLPRIWPLSSIPDTYYKGNNNFMQHSPDARSGHTTFQWALLRGASRARHMNLKLYLRESSVIVCSLLLGTLPLMITFGTVMTAVAEKTVLTQLIAAPLAVVIKASGIPEAQALASASVFAFVDQYLAVAYGMRLFTEGTRFICICLTVIGLVNLTEVGLHVWHSNIPLSFWRMTAVYVIRIFVSLFFILPAAALLFP